jgi:hypothetical protein
MQELAKPAIFWRFWKCKRSKDQKIAACGSSYKAAISLGNHQPAAVFPGNVR